MEQMEQMEKSTAGAKVTWFIIGAVVAAIVAWIIVASTQPAGVGGQREFSGQDVAVYNCNGLIQVLVFNPNIIERTTTIDLIHQAQFFSDETSFTNAILDLEGSKCSPVVTRLIRE